MKYIPEGIAGTEAVTDPYKRLFAATVLQAVRDLAADDPLKSLDALSFFLDENGAAYWLSAVESDYPSDPGTVFIRAVIGATNGESKNLGRGPSRRNVGNGRKPGYAIQGSFDIRDPEIHQNERQTSAALVKAAA